jgi:fatty acid desaturase
MTPAAARRILPPEELKALSARADAPGLVRTGIHAMAIVAGALLVWAALGTWWVWPAMFVHGLTLVTLFAPLHESVHYTAFRSRRLAEIVGWASGAAIGWNAPYYRYFHLAHHRYTQDPLRDPELAVPVPTGWPSFLLRLSGWTHWKNRALELWDIGRGEFGARADWVPVSARAALVRSVRLQIVVYGAVAAASIATGSAAVLWYWLLPVTLAQPALRAWLVCEHTLCPETDDPLVNTRTTLVPAALRLLMWNMPFHAEHHLYPQIPFHALPAAHEKLRPHFAHVVQGYGPTLAAIRASFR